MATIPSFRTWTASEIVTAAYLNTNVRDAGNFFLAVPLAELRQTSIQALTTGTVTALLMDTEDADTDGGHSTVTNTSRYTSPTAGWLQISGAAAYASNATGRRGALLLKNGAQLNGGDILIPATAASQNMVPTRTKQLSVNGTTDYLEIGGYQESGGNLNTYATSSAQSHMSVRWVHTS